MKNDLFKIFIDEIYRIFPKKHYVSIELFYKNIDEFSSIDLADTINYRLSNNKGFRYIIVLINNF